MLYYSNNLQNLIIIKDNKASILFISDNYNSFVININNRNIFTTITNNIVEWSNFIEYSYRSSIVLKQINITLYLWDFFLFNKVNYKGKSFKFKKKKMYINFILNTSHITWTISRQHLVYRIRKNKLLYFFWNSKLFDKHIYNLISFRSLNLYTKRGLRLTRCIIYKKKGKTNMKI